MEEAGMTRLRTVQIYNQMCDIIKKDQTGLTQPREEKTFQFGFIATDSP